MKRLIYRVLQKLHVIADKPAAPKTYTPEERERKLQNILASVRAPVPTERDLKMVEIVVLKYKDPEVETKCAVDVIENTDWPYKLTFYDNRPGTKNFSKIWNKLIRESTCDYVIVMDSDIFVPTLTPDWLTRMMRTFDEVPDAWAVVPRVNRTSCKQQWAQTAEEKAPTELTEPFAAQCVLYKKTVFDRVGWFDEEFLFYGQDSEWSHRAMKKGYKTYIRHDVLMDHGKHTSIGKAAKKGEFDRALEGEYARKLFEEKTRT